MYEQFSNLAVTTLNGHIDNSTTSIVVNSSSTFPTTGQFRIIIDSEIMIVTNVSGTNFTVIRSAENTTSSAHNDLTKVAHVLTSGAIKQLDQTLYNTEHTHPYHQQV